MQIQDIRKDCPIQCQTGRSNEVREIALLLQTALLTEGVLVSLAQSRVTLWERAE